MDVTHGHGRSSAVNGFHQGYQEIKSPSGVYSDI